MHLLSHHLMMHISNFAVRPGKLFVGTDMNLTILVGTKKRPQDACVVFSTDYNRWSEESREFLFSTLNYSPTTFASSRGAYPKLGTRTAFAIHEKIAQYGSFTRFIAKTNSVSVYYHSGGRYFRKCLRKKLSNEYKELKVAKGVEDVAICLLSSSFYYWLWIALSDCYHVMKGDIDMLPVPDSLLADPQVKELAARLLTDLEKHAQVRIRKRADNSQTEEINYYVGKSKPIIDEIDRMLARHYGFTDEELDFIINYDIKYRMGHVNGEECVEQ
ncbi:MAG: hypothetical protein JOZ18_07725 [Chloroflexi bacterium]|nr:hypothetical protein [Chloroflexota bacterium]